MGECLEARSRCAKDTSLVIIRDVKTLDGMEKQKLVAAMHQMKSVPSAYDPSTNAWDYFAKAHRAAVVPATEIHEGWRFFPWHREIVNRFRLELQRAANDSSLWFPYWNWSDPESTAALFSLDYIGGHGTLDDEYVVHDGNFRKGLWRVDPEFASFPAEITHEALLRTHGNGLQMCLDAANRSFVLDCPFNPPDVDHAVSVGPFTYLPDDGPPAKGYYFMQPDPGNLQCKWASLNCTRFYHNATLNTTLQCRHYAVRLPSPSDDARCFKQLLPYSTGAVGNNSAVNPWVTTKDYYKSFTQDFRPCFEGINPSDHYAKGLERLGASLHPPHGATHTYLGGSVATPTSPNDPIFIHLHWNVDRFWAEYQASHGDDWFLRGPGKALLDEELPGLSNVTAHNTLDYRHRYGYEYSSLCD